MPARRIMRIAFALLLLCTGYARAQDDEPELEIQRLSWAGLKLVLGNVTLLIDPIATDIWEGKNGVMVPFNVETRSRYVLVTHLHTDHYDKKAIKDLLAERGRLVVVRGDADDAAWQGIPVRSVDLYEPVSLGGFTAIAVPAVDGFGDTQVSWIVIGGGRRIIHCGDTVWHGKWWRYAQAYGPFDVAFLPINGVRGYWLDPPSEIPATMTPAQAVAAAVVLDAGFVTPIHYGFNDPGMYEEYPNAEKVFLETARQRNVITQIVAPGAKVKWLEKKE